MTRRERERKHERRRAHALRLDNRRPAGSEPLGDIRKHARDARRVERRAARAAAMARRAA